MSSFKDVPNQIDFPEIDKEIRAFWEKSDIFKKTEAVNRKGKHYVFYDGPPGTNGPPHIGHIMQSALKDLWPRFKTMQGYTVLRKAGWDTHGLPVELTAEQELGLSGKLEIEEYGVEKFVEFCRKIVLRCRGEWVEAITKLGRFLDFDNDYLTMSNDFIQSDWWIIKQAFDKDLLYRDYKIVPYCSRCGTGLSSHEVAQGYEDITDLTITAKFELIDEPNTFILAWTTTPWTLLGNVALTIGADIQYSKIKRKNKDGSDELVILATDTIEANKKELGKDYEVVAEFPGSDLIGKTYKPLWDFSAIETEGKIHEVIADDYVTTEDGTGVVHLALYGEDDFRLIKKFGLAQNQHVGKDGNCNKHCGAYSGRYFREEGLDVEIVKDLAARNLLFDKYRYEHSYPHCWRCKSPLMYFAMSSWFLKTTAFKDRMIEENNKINWQPPHIQSGRFGNWLENNVDWAISRDRYWGSPMSIWADEDDNMIAIESIADLCNRKAYFESSGKAITEDLDLHIPIIDDVVFKENEIVYRRVPGVLDCWFNAGAMPWGQFGYPAKEGSKEILDSQYPADFICEAIDQTRGWFYTLLAVSCLVTDQSSYKNVICTELVLDKDGKKMSKSLGNVVNPVPLIDQFGADAVRWTFYNSNPWNNKRYSDELPRESLRSIFIPIWNCYSFFVTYAKLDNWTPEKNQKPSSIELDRWIISALRTATEDITAALENYDVATAASALFDFVESLSNWYIRRSRRRFWKSESDEDKAGAYNTLYEVLVTLSKLIAPFAPFLSEKMYQNLVRSLDSNAPESVHLCEWPNPEVYAADHALEEEIAAVQEATSLARSLRVEHNLKIRQPLSELLLSTANSKLNLNHHLQSIIEEVNVKEIKLVDSSAEFVSQSIKPNWKTLGPRFGKNMQAAKDIIEALDENAIQQIISGSGYDIEVNGNTETLSAEDVLIQQDAKEGLIAQSGKHVTVALSTELTSELITEGNAREILSVIQKHRKTLNFEIADRIEVDIWGNDAIEAAITTHRDYLSKECLAKRFDFKGNPTKGEGETFEINGNTTQISLQRV